MFWLKVDFKVSVNTLKVNLTWKSRKRSWTCDVNVIWHVFHVQMYTFTIVSETSQLLKAIVTLPQFENSFLVINLRMFDITWCQRLLKCCWSFFCDCSISESLKKLWKMFPETRRYTDTKEVDRPLWRHLRTGILKPVVWQIGVKSSSNASKMRLRLF